MSRLLIRGGTLVTAYEELVADILVVGDQIAAIGRNIQADSVEVIDAEGCYVLPGIIDPHTHIQLDTGIYQTDDDWDTGTKSAALGGVTTVIDFATQFPGQTVKEAVAARFQDIGDRCHVDYALHCMLTELPATAGELDSWMADLGNAGISAIKIYTTYRPIYYQDDASLMRSMQAAARANLVVMVHAENDALVSAATSAHLAAGETDLRFHGSARPGLAEIEAVHRLLFLAAECRCELYVVHCSMGHSVEQIALARQRGQRVYAETCPQYLLLDERQYQGDHAWRVIMQPPLRDPYQPAFLWQLLIAEDIVTLGTDHCDYSPVKKQGFPFTQTAGGIPGLQTALPLMVTHGVMTGYLSWPDIVRLMSTNPAQIFHLYPRKGHLAPGSDADLVIYDPEGEKVLRDHDMVTSGGYTPYAGLRVHGRVRDTLVRGQSVVRDGILVGTAGWGTYIPARPSPRI